MFRRDPDPSRLNTKIRDREKNTPGFVRRGLKVNYTKFHEPRQQELCGVFDLQVELIKHVLVLIEIRPTMTTKNKAIGGGGKRYETSGQGTYRGFRQGVGRREIPQGVLSKIEEGFKVKAFEQRRKRRKITSCSEGVE